MKMKAAILLILTALTASAQTMHIHITSVTDHIRSRDEPSFSTPLHSKRITGTIGDIKYTMEEAAMLAYHFQVGQDYEVLKLSDKAIKIRTTDKNGHEGYESLVILSAEEVTK